jgi:hypothetical protein
MIARSPAARHHILAVHARLDSDLRGESVDRRLAKCRGKRRVERNNDAVRLSPFFSLH